jgi:hypothetical protein
MNKELKALKLEEQNPGDLYDLVENYLKRKEKSTTPIKGEIRFETPQRVELKISRKPTTYNTGR